MFFLPKWIEEAGGQANSKKIAIDPEPIADSVSTARRIAPPARLVSNPYVCGNYVKNSLVECCKQTENVPKQLSPFDPRPLLEAQSTVCMHGCPERRSTFTPTVVPVCNEGCGNQRREESSISQSDQDEADFIADIDELMQLLSY
jgi:hypothetical protein